MMDDMWYGMVDDGRYVVWYWYGGVMDDMWYGGVVDDMWYGTGMEE